LLIVILLKVPLKSIEFTYLITASSMVTDENDGGDVIKSLESLNSFIHEASKIGI